MEGPRKFLGREDILKADDLQTRDVHVPEWGGWVKIRTLTGAQRSQYQASLIQFSEDGKERRIVLEYADIRLAAMSMVDEEGNQLFSHTEVDLLGRKSASALNRVVEAAQELSALTKAEIEELVGNSDATPSDWPGSS